MYPIRKPLDRTYHPREAVPEIIREQHPWHWQAQKTDHEDADCFVENIDTIDWTQLAGWAVQKANEVRVPQKYWWWNEKTEEVMHAEDSVNHCPIYEQALQHVADNPYNEHNTQYFKFANEDLDHWYEPMKALFPQLKKMGVSLFVQPPGHCIPSHVDTYSSFMRRTGEYPDYTKLKRYMVFVSDWDWGHFFHYGNHCINQWRGGDLWDLKGGIYHGSANAGITPKITIHWSGEVA